MVLLLSGVTDEHHDEGAGPVWRDWGDDRWSGDCYLRPVSASCQPPSQVEVVAIRHLTPCELLLLPAGINVLILGLCVACSGIFPQAAGGFIFFTLLSSPVLVLPSALLGVACYFRWIDVRRYRRWRQWLKPWGLALLLSIICCHLVFYLVASDDYPDDMAAVAVYYVGVAQILLSPVWITLSAIWYSWVSSRMVDTDESELKTPAQA